ncbi:hypothetical protein ElyMa_006086200 [Elysia marginata]|uniref:Uncharacterized protein n=1 Tax=Elysia marginata TaxID=1093978 RepID=A0AAV4GSL4_9GAST|nr:hypothetical protein ElyMa_006086200 [Elysia marginata]
MLTRVSCDSVLYQDKLEKFEIHMTDMMNKGDDRSKKVKTKSQADIPPDEIAQEEERRSNLLKRVFVKTKPVGGNTGPLDCNSLKMFRGELSFLNASDIRDMGAQDFEDCLEDMQKPQWDDGQLEAIGSKLKQVFGNETMRWQADAPMRAGPLIRALPKDDLLDITFTEDIIAMLGQMEMEANESAEILDKFAQDVGMPDLSWATADQLASMGKLACGLQADVISSMDAATIRMPRVVVVVVLVVAVVMVVVVLIVAVVVVAVVEAAVVAAAVCCDAAASLGDADCLVEDQLKEFGKKLEEDLGSDWATLPPNKIAEFGVLVGKCGKPR